MVNHIQSWGGWVKAKCKHNMNGILLAFSKALQTPTPIYTNAYDKVAHHTNLSTFHTIFEYLLALQLMFSFGMWLLYGWIMEIRYLFCDFISTLGYLHG
jgi:hypothetical protein